jgi:hypothetical protein
MRANESHSVEKTDINHMQENAELAHSIVSVTIEFSREGRSATSGSAS